MWTRQITRAMWVRLMREAITSECVRFSLNDPTVSRRPYLRVSRSIDYV